MKKLFISDLKPGDSIFGEVFAVRSYKKSATRNNKPYIDLELADRSGAVKAKIWSDDLASCDVVGDGDVVSLNGTVEDFQGALQIKITNLTKTEKFDLTDLQQRSKFDIEEMYRDVQNTISGIKNPHIKNLLDNVFSDEELKNRFLYGPGAYKIHHNYIGGLLEHTWEMLKMAEPLKKQYPKLNIDLLNSGIILHDIGKAYEFDQKTTVVFRNEGKLLGHVFLGAEIVKAHAPKDMPEDLLDEILHIVLAHLGEKEYGASVVPKTAEAMAVFVIDYASFRINLAYNMIHENQLGEEMFTQYSPHLKTELYRSPYLDDDSNLDIPF
jgi:3'-5' exoribonuclease